MRNDMRKRRPDFGDESLDFKFQINGRASRTRPATIRATRGTKMLGTATSKDITRLR